MTFDPRPNGHNPETDTAGDPDLAAGIAIIGMSGRFPGAPDIATLWNLVERGGNAFRIFATEELEDGFTDEVRASPEYVACRPHLADVDRFDAEFFGMFAREAALTDPQHRVFLEICWEALESAGYDPYKSPGLVGVFAGCSMPTYLLNNVLADRAAVEEVTSNYQIGCYNQLIGSLGDALATRIAYKLNLRGPAFTLQSACSTSLLAVSQACQNLLTYSCDMALAGGISISMPQKRGYIYQEGGMVSRDGVCRPFDADASGTVFGSGAGVVLLKRLEDALADGDVIYATIRGYAVNNDGSDKIGFTAPSAEGQADAISAAIAHAGIDPATIGYIECHGTATPLGDPIEFSGLKEAFTGAHHQKETCALGSLKGSIGHLDAAAGVEERDAGTAHVGHRVAVDVGDTTDDRDAFGHVRHHRRRAHAPDLVLGDGDGSRLERRHPATDAAGDGVSPNLDRQLRGRHGQTCLELGLLHHVALNQCPRVGPHDRNVAVRAVEKCVVGRRQVDAGAGQNRGVAGTVTPRVRDGHRGLHRKHQGAGVGQLRIGDRERRRVLRGHERVAGPGEEPIGDRGGRAAPHQQRARRRTKHPHVVELRDRARFDDDPDADVPGIDRDKLADVGHLDVAR